MEDLVNKPAASLESLLRSSFEGETVLVTGHNGFVGSWLSHWLVRSGATVVGLSLPTVPGSLADTTHLNTKIQSHEADIRDLVGLRSIVDRYKPSYVFHLAAQALVLPSYEDPIETLTTNILGTANVLESLRGQDSVRSCVVVTSDKCYANGHGPHKEGDPLGGDDPYSASKAAAELVAHTYRVSFLAEADVGLATARAGNIIGGGDWSPHRIVPDCMYAAMAGSSLELRQPHAVRPWQHVLDAVAGYLRLAVAAAVSPKQFGRSWNFGPDESASTTVRDLVRTMLARWSSLDGRPSLVPTRMERVTPHERAHLTLDSALARDELGWHPQLSLEATVDWTVDWYWAHLRDPSSPESVSLTLDQIDRYQQLETTA